MKPFQKTFFSLFPVHSQRTLLIPFLALLITSCGGGGKKGELSGRIKIDGSSTVYPITEAVAEEYREEAPRVRVTVGFSGTGGGFKKFIRGETDINDASRAIKPSEQEQCSEKGIAYERFSVAYDGIAVLTNPENDWLNEITVEELKKIWRPEAQETVKKWSDIRPEWPDKEIHLYGPGVASGTYDYFTEAIVGASGKSRGDYTASEDDNVLVQGVSTDKYALGFFGLAYYEENQKKLKLIAVDNGNGAIKPTRDAIAKDTYAPLSRPLYIYARKSSVKRPEVRDFMEFYLNNAGKLAKEVGYIAMPEEEYQKQLKKFRDFAGIKPGKGKKEATQKGSEPSS